MAVFVIRGDTLYIDEDEQALSASETALLYLLYSNPNVIFGSEDIIKECWPDRVVSAGSVPVSIKHIRDVLKKVTSTQLIVTHKGKGYSFNDPRGEVELDIFNAQSPLCLEHKTNFNLIRANLALGIIAIIFCVAGALCWLDDAFTITNEDMDTSSSHMEVRKYKKKSNGEIVFHDSNGKVIRCDNTSCLETSN